MFYVVEIALSILYTQKELAKINWINNEDFKNSACQELVQVTNVVANWHVDNEAKYLCLTNQWYVFNLKMFPFSPYPPTQTQIYPRTYPIERFLPTSQPIIFRASRNDLRKVLEESDDSLGDLETTRSTTAATTTSTTKTTTPPPPPTTKSTTVSTTKSTTTHRSTKRYYAPSKSPDDVPKTPKTYFSNSFYHNNNQNNINGQTDRSKNLYKGVTQKAHVHTETPTPAPAKSTINPFYFGLSRAPQNNTTTQKSTRYLQFTSTARTPYSFQYYTASRKPDLLASTPSIEAEVDNSYPENPLKRAAETERPRSSTYNPVFDIYFKQIGRQRTSTTKSPFASS